jgi:hypothetical protein
MGFGYKAHRDAGVPYRVRDRKAAKDLNDKVYIKEIRSLVEKHPEQAEWVARMAKNKWPPFDMLINLQLRLGLLEL